MAKKMENEVETVVMLVLSRNDYQYCMILHPLHTYDVGYLR